MKEGCKFRRWDELSPDLLGLIFRNLSLQEVLTIVPTVCKSWDKVVRGPYCWEEIDIEEWSNNCCCHDKLHQMLELLITRSCGSLRRLCVSGLFRESTFSFIADNAESLQMLQLLESDIGDHGMIKVSGMFSNITFLDISYCLEIGARSLEAIGKNCKCLTGLRRNMYGGPYDYYDEDLLQDDEVLAIAATMPKLKQLEIACMMVGTTSIIEVIMNCKHLELLDIRGCPGVYLDENIVKKFPRLKVIGTLVSVDWDSLDLRHVSDDVMNALRAQHAMISQHGICPFC